MNIATKKYTFQEYVEFCETSQAPYELVRGELQLMTPPVWLHYLIAEYLSDVFKAEIKQHQSSWLVFQGAGQQTSDEDSRLPDLSIVPFDAIANSLDQTAILSIASLLIVEIVSESAATQDYREKVKEYQAKGIREYWIIDPDPFGAAKYIGTPKQPTVSVYELENGSYQVKRYRGNDWVASPTFPALQLTAEQILKAGR